jgi:hypothetical protein
LGRPEQDVRTDAGRRRDAILMSWRESLHLPDAEADRMTVMRRSPGDRPRTDPPLTSGTACLAGAAALLLAGCNLPPGEPATPQRPSFCTSPSTTAAGTWEVEAGLLVDPGDSWELPTTTKYGLDGHTEASFSLSPLITADDNTGLGDSGLGWRHRFVDADGAAPAVAWLATVKLPTADESRGLGTGHVDGFAGLTTAGAFGSFSWCVLGQLGLVGQQGEAADVERDYGVTGQWALDARNSFFIEYSDRKTPESDTHIGQVRAGQSFAERPDFVLDWALYFPTTHDAGDLQVTAGFTRNLGTLRTP